MSNANNPSYFTNKKLKKIVNVYKKTENGHKTYGFGDYLRGCFCLIQICKKLGLEFDIDISQHPISNYITSTNQRYDIDYSKITHFENINYTCTDGKTNTSDSRKFYYEFINHLNSVDSENYYLECNSFPAWKKIYPLEKKYLQFKLSPSQEMNNYIADILKNFKLENASFGIIHIRTGDSCLLQGQPLEFNKFSKIVNTLIQITDKSKKYFILSDNNTLKGMIQKCFPNIQCYILPITHLGESTDQTNDSLKNTMLDFFIIGYAKFVISLSFHTWGSGFSEWSAIMHDIPYKKIII